MRPNKLVMSAFGPYAGKVEVELDKLGTNGIYLITGDTGAGKTTIFDAITYALFGEASGENRETSMFRSKYAEAETPTEVELYFTCNGKEYYIKRNPEYERLKSRGDGVTTEKANAEIRKLIKVSYGCSNFTRFKNRVKFVINSDEPILGTKKKHTNKRDFKPRGKYKK